MEEDCEAMSDGGSNDGLVTPESDNNFETEKDCNAEGFSPDLKPPVDEIDAELGAAALGDHGIGQRAENGQNPAESFDGVEKMVVIVFTRHDRVHYEDDCHLKRIPRSALDKWLKSIGCKIVVSASTAKMNSPILNDSSLIMTRNKIAFKTFRKTNLANCLQTFWQLVKNFTSFDLIEKIYYSHKLMLSPSLQVSDYCKFDNEREILDSFLGVKAAAYSLGRINGDRYYLYSFQTAHSRKCRDCNTKTLELMMTEIDTRVKNVLMNDWNDAWEKSGVARLLPGLLFIDHVAEPEAFALKAVRNEKEYVTIHASPGPDYSSVSFETNILLHCLTQLIHNVVEMYDPAKFMVTLTTDLCYDLAHNELGKMERVGDKWNRCDIQFTRIGRDDVSFAAYKKTPQN